MLIIMCMVIIVVNEGVHVMYEGIMVAIRRRMWYMDIMK